MEGIQKESRYELIWEKQDEGGGANAEAFLQGVKTLSVAGA